MKQSTLRQLLSAGKPVKLVVPKNEADDYRLLLNSTVSGGLVEIVKCPFDTLWMVRRWITRRLFKRQRIVMLDDDLEFLIRPDMSSNAVVETGPLGISKMMHTVETYLNSYPMVGISSKQENVKWTQHAQARYGYTMSGVYALDLDVFRDTKVRFGRVEYMDHLDIVLRVQAYTEYTNKILYDFCWKQLPLRSGGCFSYRTKKAVHASVRRLAQLYPNYVTLVGEKLNIHWSKFR